ncbi:MAG TPA: NADH-quinone oxidoreductase subunit J [Candidatus Dormibacteraeota bacterium]|nr:NADH-quinone oxidoreductase subunit J [Candidatus Dormibacteraeota bacterium]
MRAWLYLIAAAIAGAIITTPALIVLILMGGSFNDALVAGLATLMLASGIAVVSMRDIIRCGLAMIVCFLALAGIYVTLGAPMVAAAQVLVYIGAISVLILFAIMLTADKSGAGRLTFQTQAAPAAIAAIIVFVLVGVGAYSTDWTVAASPVRIATTALAQLLFDNYVLALEAVSVLLLAAVVGGVFLAKREGGE